jgi:cell volume regulation protein A
MEMARILGLPAALLILAYVANRLSRLTRVPDIIVLLLIGITLGPVLHWIDPRSFAGFVDVLGTIALILILFQGGLELSLRQALRYFPAALLLLTLSYGLSLWLSALMGRSLLHLGWSDSLLLGAALGCTSGTIVIPALQQIPAPEPVKIILTIEATLGEVLAVLLVGSMLNTSPDSAGFPGMAMHLSHHLVIAILVGVGVGAIWSHVWRFIAGQPNSNILTLGVVLGVYAMVRAAGGSGLLAVLIFGLTLANLPRTPHMVRQDARLLAFHAELGFLVRSFFFVLLGVVAEFISRQYIVPILGIVAGLLLARFVAVQGSRWAVRDVVRSETDLLFWMLPRGLVTAVLALQIVAVRGPVFGFLPAMAFTVVLVTNLFVVAGSVRAGNGKVIDDAIEAKSLLAGALNNNDSVSKAAVVAEAAAKS